MRARLIALLVSSTASTASFAEPPAETPPGVPQVSVPFACGQAFPVSQVHHVGSHLLNDDWAWDFRMPEGTPVVAAAGGVVRLTRGDSTVGGCDPRLAKDANYVVIDHGKALETQYLHFSRVVVSPGDVVYPGALLGFSGATGWACGAHLHFKVAQELTPGWNNPSIQARIAGYGDPALDTWVSSPPCNPSPILATRRMDAASNGRRGLFPAAPMDGVPRPVRAASARVGMLGAAVRALPPTQGIDAAPEGEAISAATPEPPLHDGFPLPPSVPVPGPAGRVLTRNLVEPSSPDWVVQAGTIPLHAASDLRPPSGVSAVDAEPERPPQPVVGGAPRDVDAR